MSIISIYITTTITITIPYFFTVVVRKGGEMYLFIFISHYFLLINNHILCI